jgi:hypothetical protein
LRQEEVIPPRPLPAPIHRSLVRVLDLAVVRVRACIPAVAAVGICRVDAFGIATPFPWCAPLWLAG